MGRSAARSRHRGAASHLSAHRGGGPGLSRRPPERLEGLIDSHCHLQHERFDPDRDAVIDRARAAGIDRILVPGWDLASSEAALALAERHEGHIQTAVGIHPHHAAAADESTWRSLEQLAADGRCAAIGEIGLDFHRNLSPPDRQHEAFDRQLELAARLDKPVIVHDREAHAEITARLIRWAGREGSAPRGVLHAFSGDAEMATRLAATGFLVSFALPVAFRSAAGPRAAAATLPAGTILVETDAPYLGPDSERRNEPTTALRVVAELARLRRENAAAIAMHARSAYKRLIGE